MQASSYFDLLSITTNSALDTAAICYRKARRDVHRIHALLTHPRTVKAAKIAVWCLYLGAVIAFALGQTARIIFQQWVDAQVARALEPSERVDDLPSLVKRREVAAEMTGADLSITETETARMDSLVAVIKYPDLPTEIQPKDSLLTTPPLRREYTAVGVRS